MSDKKLSLVASGIAKGVIVKSAQDTGGDQIEIKSLSDMQAAIAVRDGKADYFIGSCSTGQGGALSMARAVLGEDSCVLLSTGSGILDDSTIREHALGNYRAFGISADHAAKTIPVLIRSLLEKHQNA